ncbi:MAG: hypothetical protein Pars2KO_20530 [Parasphingorhabdus sp.]
MGKTSTALAGVVLLGSWGSSVSAETPNTEKPMLHHAEKAVVQPAKDVNLHKDKIPARLLEIQRAPYDLTNLDGCRAITSEIASLRPLLGPDVNEDPKLTKAEKRERSVSRIAGGFLGGFIPFRGVLREVTGANAQRRKYRAAYAAGFARRSFLKGVAVSQNCEAKADT